MRHSATPSPALTMDSAVDMQATSVAGVKLSAGSEARRSWKAMGLEPLPGISVQMAAYVKSERQKWAR